ncbi:MAG: tetratricopeptide repeat protein [Armatimonadota bacterium]|nr:tetratricopeptide repeat protein [Armatimonadota bacterium]
MRPIDGCQAGIEAFKSGNYDDAIYKLEMATLDNPRDFRAFAFLGAAYAQQGRYSAAVGSFKHAAGLEPGVAKVHYNLGQAYEAAGVPREAWFEYKNALEIDPYYQPARAAVTLLGAKMMAIRQRPGLEVRS